MNTLIVRKLLHSIRECGNLDGAKAYADAIVIVMDVGEQATLVLEGWDENQKVSLIKALREKFNWGLKEALDYITACPQRFAPMPVHEANSLKGYLSAHGGKVRVE